MRAGPTTELTDRGQLAFAAGVERPESQSSGGSVYRWGLKDGLSRIN